MSLNVGAAAAFLTPVATPPNLIVMGPGGYRFGDFWRLGILLALSTSWSRCSGCHSSGRCIQVAEAAGCKSAPLKSSAVSGSLAVQTLTLKMSRAASSPTLSMKWSPDDNFNLLPHAAAARTPATLSIVVRSVGRGPSADDKLLARERVSR